MRGEGGGGEGGRWGGGGGNDDVRAVSSHLCSSRREASLADLGQSSARTAVQLHFHHVCVCVCLFLLLFSGLEIKRKR